MARRPRTPYPRIKPMYKRRRWTAPPTLLYDARRPPVITGSGMDLGFWLGEFLERIEDATIVAEPSTGFDVGVTLGCGVVEPDDSEFVPSGYYVLAAGEDDLVDAIWGPYESFGGAIHRRDELASEASVRFR